MNHDPTRTSDDRHADPVLTMDVAPRVLPPSWRFVGDYGNVVQHIHTKLQIIVTGNVERDGKRWVHVSVSTPTRLPTWQELRDVKDWIIGRDKLAIQVLPPADQYVNLHPYVLHLWHCLDADPVPDFRHQGVI